jgi:hypothetical protein
VAWFAVSQIHAAHRCVAAARPASLLTAALIWVSCGCAAAAFYAGITGQLSLASPDVSVSFFVFAKYWIFFKKIFTLFQLDPTPVPPGSRASATLSPARCALPLA